MSLYQEILSKEGSSWFFSDLPDVRRINSKNYAIYTRDEQKNVKVYAENVSRGAVIFNLPAVQVR